MLAEFVKSIQHLSNQAREPKVTQLPGGKMLVTVGEGPGIEYDNNPIPAKDNNLGTLDALIDWCSHYDEIVDVQIDVHAYSILAVYDRQNPKGACDQCAFQYEQSVALDDLLEWEASPRSQSKVVKALRTDLYGTCDPKYLQVFRRIDFSRKNDGARTVSNTGESMGKSVEAVAQSSAGEIPEVLRFTVSLFDIPGARPQELVFACTVDPNTESIAINAVGGSVFSAIRNHRLAMVERLKEAFPTALVLEKN